MISENQETHKIKISFWISWTVKDLLTIGHYETGAFTGNKDYLFQQILAYTYVIGSRQKR